MGRAAGGANLSGTVVTFGGGSLGMLGSTTETVAQGLRMSQEWWGLALAAVVAATTVLAVQRARAGRAKARERGLEARVTEAVAELRESEERYRSFVHNFRGIAFRGDFDFRPSLFHGAVEEITGYRPEDFLAGAPRWDQVIHPDDRPDLLAATEHDLRVVPGFSSEREYRIVHRDGTVRWVRQLVQNLCDGSGRPVAVQGSIYDITERREMEEALRSSEARLAEAHRVAGLGTWEWLVDTDELIWSEQMYRLLRRDPALGPMDDLWLQAVHPQDRLEVSTRLNEALLGRRPFSVDHRILCDDGSVRWIHAEGEVFRGSGGRPLRVVGTALDITDRVRREEEGRRLEAQLLEAQKMESLGLLAGGIAHDFNNLLMAILGNTDLARLRLPAGSPARDYLDGIEVASRRAADLAAQMLAYAGKGRTVVEHTDLSAVVGDMAHLLRAAIPDQAQLHCRLEPDLPAVEADVTQLRQVVMNLILNAAEALGPEGGEIVLSTDTLWCDRAALHLYHLGDEVAEGRFVVLDVADSGCGMDEGTVARIFDPFFSTKFTGRGLGLAAVLGIVRSHRGAIRVCSERHRGTTMRVLLPAADGSVPRAEEGGPGEGQWRGRGTVLVADDDEAVRVVACGLLESLGFDVLTAADGVEAVEIFRCHQERIVVVLLDVAMPKLDGIGALRELRRIRPDLRVILCSGYSEVEAMARLGDAPSEEFLEKPFSLEALRERLRAVLSG